MCVFGFSFRFSLLMDLLYTYEPQIENHLTLDRLHCQDDVLSRAFQGNG